MNNKIEMSYLLSSRNADGDLYDCDIDRWIGIKLDSRKRSEIKSQLRKMAGVNVKD